MDSAPAINSPSTDEKLWTKLRDRVDSILESRNPKPSTISPLPIDSDHFHGEDPLLLIRGLDSVASSLSHLTNTLTAAQQGVRDLAKPSRKRAQNENACPKPKRRRGSEKWPEVDAIDDGAENNGVAVLDEGISADVEGYGNMKKAKNLAVSMASKAALLAREMKTVKSELQFMQERCSLLEEENRRLRDGLEKGDGQEEDDLVRLQLEALLAEKSRLANENANLTRENQCLHQLVEYYQLTSQDIQSPYELAIPGMCLDFSSPLGKIDSDSEGENGNEYEHCDPSDNKLGFASSPDSCK